MQPTAQSHDSIPNQPLPDEEALPHPATDSIDIDGVAKGFRDDDDRQIFLRLAAIARHGGTQALGHALALTARGGRDAAQELIDLKAERNPANAGLIMAFRAALDAKRVGLPSRIQPTPRAQARLERSEQYRDLRRHMQREPDLAREYQKTLQYFMLAHLACQAALSPGASAADAPGQATSH